MTPPTASATRPVPVPVTIGRHPPAGAAATLPVPVSVEPIGDDEYQIIGDLDKESEATMCNCSASDDNPYQARTRAVSCSGRTLAGAAQSPTLRGTAPRVHAPPPLPRAPGQGPPSRFR